MPQPRRGAARAATTRQAAAKNAPRRSYHHGDLRAVLLDQVGRIVKDRGLAQVSIREVARRARVSHAAPAHHFGNKAGLLTAFAAQGFDRLADGVKAGIEAAGATRPPEILEAMGRAYVRFALDNPEHFAIMFPGETLNWEDPEYLRAADRAYGPLIAVVSDAARAGYLTVDPLLVAASAWSLVHGLASLWLSGRLQERTGATDADALAADVSRFFVDSVMRRTPTPGGTAA